MRTLIWWEHHLGYFCKAFWLCCNFWGKGIFGRYNRLKSISWMMFLFNFDSFNLYDFSEPNFFYINTWNSKIMIGILVLVIFNQSVNWCHCFVYIMTFKIHVNNLFIEYFSVRWFHHCSNKEKKNKIDWLQTVFANCKFLITIF